MKRFFEILFITLGALFIIPAIYVLCFGNFTMGIAFSAIAGTISILMGVYFQKLLNSRWLCVFLCVCMASGVLVVTALAIYGSVDTVTYEEDAIIVLGSSVIGKRVSVPLAKRLDEAIRYTEKNQDALIIVSGGQGPQEEISEALAMKNYLMARGIDEEKIIMEDRATSTYENFVYSKQIIDSVFGEGAAVCFTTNGFHVFRSHLISQKVGIDATNIGADEDILALPVNYLRECAAIIKFVVLGY